VNRNARRFCSVKVLGRVAGVDGFRVKPAIAHECMLNSLHVGVRWWSLW